MSLFSKAKPLEVPPLDINSLLSAVRDSRRNGLYDRVLLRAGVPTPREIVCFQRALGPLVTLVETNMQSAGILTHMQDAIICRFLFLFQPGCADTDVAAILRNYIWEFWIMQKVMQREPMLVCTMQGSMADLVEGFGVADNGIVKPYGRPYSFRLGNHSIYLPPLCQFKLVIRGNSITPSADIDFYSILDGTLDRPVQ